MKNNKQKKTWRIPYINHYELMIVQTEESATATDFKEGYYKKRKFLGLEDLGGPWFPLDLHGSDRGSSECLSKRTATHPEASQVIVFSC